MNRAGPPPDKTQKPRKDRKILPRFFVCVGVYRSMPQGQAWSLWQRSVITAS